MTTPAGVQSSQSAIGLLSGKEALGQRRVRPFRILRLVARDLDPRRLRGDERVIGDALARILAQRAAAHRDDVLRFPALAVDRRAAVGAKMAELPRTRFVGGQRFLSGRDVEAPGIHDDVGDEGGARGRPAFAAMALVHEPGLALDLVLDSAAQARAAEHQVCLQQGWCEGYTLWMT